MQTPAPPSLRERKRLATSLEIHDAAADLTLEHGLHQVTIEQIADRAGISQRTFFNYFASKDDAVLGVQEPCLSEETRAGLYDEGAGDLLTRVVFLLSAVFRSTITPGSSKPRRKELIQAHPELRSRIMTRIGDAERMVHNAITETTAGDRDVPADMRELADRPESVHALFYLAGAVVRFIHFRDPGGVSSDDPDAVRQGIQTFREVVASTL